MLAAGESDGSIRLWSLHPLFPGPSKASATVLRGHGVSIAALMHHPELGLASGGLDHKVKLWDVDRGRCTSTYKVCWFVFGGTPYLDAQNPIIVSLNHAT